MIGVLIILALIEGYLEQVVYRGNYRGFGGKLFGWVRTNYHVPLFVKWFILCFILGEWQFIGAFCVIEDWAYFAFHPRDELGPDDWVSKPLGGVWVWNFWLPNSYVLGLSVTVMAYYVSW